MKLPIKYFCLLILSTICYSSYSQEVISLKKAIELGLKHNLDIKISNIQIKEKYTLYHEEIYNKLPDITASVSVRRNLIIPTTPIPAIMLNPQAKENEIYPAKFGTNYTSITGLNLEYPIFDPNKTGSLRTKKLEYNLSKVDAKITKEKIISKIILDYISVLIAQSQLELCKIDSSYTYEAYNYLNNRLQEGLVSDIDCTVGKQDYNMSLSRLSDARSIFKKAKATLCADLGFDFNDNLNLDEDLDKIEQDALPKRDICNDLRYSKDKLQLKIQSLGLKSSLLGLLPSLTLEGYYGANYFNDIYKPFEKDNWYGNSYIGIKISFPIIGFGRKIRNYQNSKLKFSEAWIRLKDNETKRNLQLFGYQSDILNAKHKMEINKENLSIAQENHLAIEAKLKEGKVYPAELTKSLQKYRQARTEYLSSVFDYFIAATKLRVGILDY